MAPEDPSRRNEYYPDYTVTCPSRHLGLSLTTGLVVGGAHPFYRGQVHLRDIVVAFGEFNIEGLDGSEAQFNCIQQLVADLPRPQPPYYALDKMSPDTAANNKHSTHAQTTQGCSPQPRPTVCVLGARPACGEGTPGS